MQSLDLDRFGRLRSFGDPVALLIIAHAVCKHERFVFAKAPEHSCAHGFNFLEVQVLFVIAFVIHLAKHRVPYRDQALSIFVFDLSLLHRKLFDKLPELRFCVASVVEPLRKHGYIR